MLHFPRSLVRAASMERPRLVGAARTGGRSASGIVTMSRSDGGGQWAFGYHSLSLATRDHVRAFEAIKEMLGEGEVPISVPVRDRNAPWPVVNGQPLMSYSVPHSDGSLFDDGSGYGQEVIVIETAAPAALRATSLSLAITYSGGLRGGELFSIEHTVLGDRLYRIVNVPEQDDESATVTIQPPLREAIASGVPVQFDWPACVMQVAEKDAYEMDANHFGRPSLSFVESFLPLD